MKIGQLFKLDSEHCLEYYMLCQVAFGKVTLINMKSGNRWSEYVNVIDPNDITISEFNAICNGEKFVLLSDYRLTVE